MKFQFLLDNIPHMLAYFNRYLVCEMSNASYATFFEKDKSELVGMDIFSLLGIEGMTYNMPYILKVLEGTSQQFEKKFSKKGLPNRFLSISYLPFSPKGNIEGFFSLVTDVTERKENEKKILRLAHYDSLTRLPNRSLFEDKFDQALNKGEKFALLFLDLDDFKKVNDSVGHAGGDIFLREVADRLLSSVRPTDTVCRYGGDEFTILLSEISHEDGIGEIATEICTVISRSFIYNNSILIPSISIGVALYPKDGQTYEELIRDADLAMYEAKSKGKNQIKYFSSDLGVKAKAKIEMENDLESAIENNEFQVYYQPQVNLKTGKVEACEALLRWKFNGGLIPPDKFIPIAEESGQILKIGEWVLQKVAEDIPYLKNSSGTPLRISVNISAIQLLDPNFPDMVIGILQEYTIPSGILELEITESMAMIDINRSIRIIHDLSELGVKFLIDDFGTGHSSLSYLKQLKPHYLKIDKSFVKDILTDEEDKIIVEAIIGLSHNLKLRVVAEGVESIEQLTFLKFGGCDLVQGYFIAKPMPLTEFQDYLVNAELMG